MKKKLHVFQTVVRGLSTRLALRRGLSTLRPEIAATSLLIVAALLGSFLLRDTVAFVQAAASTSPAPRTIATMELELANRCRLRADGPHVSVTSPDGRPLFSVDLPGASCETSGVLNQGDGIHVFLGSSGPRGETLTVLRVSTHGSRIVLRRTLGDGSWMLRDRTLLIYPHAASTRPSELLTWNGRAYDVARDARMWR